MSASRTRFPPSPEQYPQEIAQTSVPILRFERIGFKYDGRDILKNISFSVRRGEFITLLGPSGCGKTTMLNIIAGFLRPDSGLARVNDREITGPGPDRGVVFQSYALFDWMNIEDNIAFSLRCAGKSRRQQRAVAAQMVALVGLRGFEKYFPYQLSGGMRQRCGLARVLAANPSVMLMDEPFAAVDVQTRETLQEEIVRIKTQTKCTVIFITHSIDEAVFMADRVFLMRKGQLGAFDEFVVDLPEPRSSAENRLHPEFLAIREKIYRTLRADG